MDEPHIHSKETCIMSLTLIQNVYIYKKLNFIWKQHIR